MARILLVGMAFLMAGVAIFAQPAIGQNGVVNAASNIPTSMPTGAIGRGALFTISGVRLTAGASAVVTITKNGANTEAKILKAGATRIDAWMPPSAPLGPVSLVVTAAGKSSRPFAIEVTDDNPGLFSRNGQGWGPALADNVLASGARLANSSFKPAHPGETVALAATGTGARELTLVIGNRTIKATPVRLKTEGREEIRVTIPADVPLGCWVPVYIQVTPVRASNVVTLAIGSGTAPCVAGLIPADLSKRIGAVALSRTQVKTVGKTARLDGPGTVVDDARVSFIATGKDPALTPFRLLPPPGTCTAYTASFQANAGLASSFTTIVSVEGTGLDAGTSLTLSRGEQMRSIVQSADTPGRYRARLGSSKASDRKGTAPLFLSPDEYLLKGPGGKNVGAFLARFHLPEQFDWTDWDQIAEVDRTRGVAVHWRGTSPKDIVLIVARNVDQVATAIGLTLCVAPGESSQFAIPPPMLSSIPSSSENPGESYDELAVGALAVRAPILASGLDSGSVISVYLSERFVHYR